MTYFSEAYPRVAYPKAIEAENKPGLRKSQLGAMHAIAPISRYTTGPR
jgi:hypothetical protein